MDDFLDSLLTPEGDSFLTSYVYQGIVLVGSEDRPISGHLADEFGISRLFDVVLTDERFSFTKQYTHRRDTIRYEFVKDPRGWYEGTYDGVATKSGPARCVLAEIPDGFFN